MNNILTQLEDLQQTMITQLEDLQQNLKNLQNDIKIEESVKENFLLAYRDFKNDPTRKTMNFRITKGDN